MELGPWGNMGRSEGSRELLGFEWMKNRVEWILIDLIMDLIMDLTMDFNGAQSNSGSTLG